MENTKKRQKTSSETKLRKKVKIETAADAVRALDNIDVYPIALPPEMCIGSVSGSTKLPNNFFENRKRMTLSNIGEVYSTGGTVNRLSLPLTDDLRSLIESHERWEVVAHKLRDKCMELKHQMELFWQVSPPPSSK